MEDKEKFRELYNKLYSENFEELESLRKQEKSIGIKTIIIFGIIFMFCISFVIYMNFASQDNSNIATIDPVVIYIIALILVIIIGTLLVRVLKISKNSSVVNERPNMYNKEINDEENYKNIFKEKIIFPIIKSALNDGEYYYDMGLSREEYNQGNWEKYDRYESEDKIVTNISTNENNNLLSKMIMAEVHTQIKERDSEGTSHYVTLFHGLAGYMELPKDMGCYIKVINNKLNLFGKAKDNLQMDMSEFEKVFDVETNDKVKAMQILTADIMTEFLEIIEKNNFKFEFYINNNVMHIRFHTGELFEPAVFKESLQFEYLEKYFDVINSIKNITEHICNIIMSIEL